MSSFHKAEVVPLVLEKHPNADSLSICKVQETLQCVTQTAQWTKDGVLADRCVHVLPDSLVPISNPLFSFLAKDGNSEGYARIKPIKLRGVYSYGMLVPCDQNIPFGTDMADALEIKHYNPDTSEDQELAAAGRVKGPELLSLPSTYDLESLAKYFKAIPNGHLVQITEKVDGSFSLLTYHNGQFHVKSKKEWKREFPDLSNFTIEFFMGRGKTEDEAKELVANINSKEKKQDQWWKALRDNEPLQKMLQDNPGLFVMGELFGNTNRIKYKIPEGNRIAIFDMWSNELGFLNTKATEVMCDMYGVEHVPVIHESVPWEWNNIQQVLESAEGKTATVNSAPGVIREGIVVKPCLPMYDVRLRRLALKHHSPSFLNL